MLEYKRERQAGGENPVDEEKICVEVLGYKSGYLRGRGVGLKPRLSHRSYREELDEAKKNARVAQERADKAEQKVLLFSEQLENQKVTIDDLKEGLVATQRATTEMVSYFQQLRQTSHFPTTSPRFHVPPYHSQQNIHTPMHGFAPKNIQNSNQEFDAFTREPELRQLFHEVSRSYPGYDAFRAHGDR